MAKESILVVDDERDILELLEYNLAKEGYAVVTVETGEDAIDAARRKLPDLILLDLMLPGVDGLEVCRALKADPTTAHIPIVMVTAKGGEADIVTGLELGADDYVTKPFSPRVLAARVKAVLRRDVADDSDRTT
ncbi:MAG TPA: response regulator, partial [Thermoleophilia bacterium]|nr:response regulator [Thermoleophilia bacterium]